MVGHTFYTAIVLVIKYPRLSCLCVVAIELWPNVKNRVRAWDACTIYVTYTSDYFASSVLYCFVSVPDFTFLAVPDRVVVIRHGNVLANVFQLECMTMG